MSSTNDFIITNENVLFQYAGPGGEVIIPEGVKKIGSCSFKNCSTITSVSLPVSLEEIEDFAFQNCTALESVSVPGTLKSLKSYVFSGCTALRSVAIEEGVTGIAMGMFAGCTALESVVLPDSVQAIGENAFWGCSNLESARMGKGLACIYRNAFAQCRKLKNLILPAQNIEIRDCAFENCYGLADENGFVIVGDVLFGYCGNGGELVVPDGVASISVHAFRDQKTITGITIPDSVSYIGNGAFSLCSNLCSVRIPLGIKELNSGVFWFCTELKEIIIPESVEKIGETSFQECGKLQRVNIPDNVTEIGKQAFEGCTQLYDLRLPKNIQYEQLTSARIDAVSAYVLGNLDASEEILSKVRGLIKTRREKLIQKIIESDSEQAFARFCDGWKKIKLEHLEEYIEIATKANATKVTAALLDYKQRNYSAKKQAAKEQDRVEKDLGVKELSVADWRKIFKFTVKEGIAILTDYKGTEPSVVIPEKIGKNVVAQIGWDGFKGCKGLREVTIPATMKEIGFSAFDYCPDLETVRFCHGIESTGDCSFTGCKNLKHAYIPASVTEIRSFANCHNLMIHGKAGSYAETYAKENNIPFVVE